MQAFKEREPEDVRWRSVTAHVGDMKLLAQLEDMRVLVYQNTTPVDLDVLLPGSASEVTKTSFTTPFPSGTSPPPHTTSEYDLRFTSNPVIITALY